MRKHDKPGGSEIIRLDDKLVYECSWKLSSLALKTVCYAVTRYVDVKSGKLPELASIPVRDLSIALADGRKGKNCKTLYRDLEKLCRELSLGRIMMRSEEATRRGEAGRTFAWCRKAVIREGEGLRYLDFYFAEELGDFLLNLSRYCRVQRREVNRLTSAYALRLFPMLKGDRNRRGNFEQKSVRVFELRRLRFLLGTEDKYAGFREFNRNVIIPGLRQINERTTVRVYDVKIIRKSGGRRVTHLELHFHDQACDAVPDYQSRQPAADYIPAMEDVAVLPRAKKRAYEILTDFGIKPGIALRRIVMKIGGSESDGFEDYFVECALSYFKSNARAWKGQSRAAATFVNWWVDHKVFDVNSTTWSRINERVSGKRKQLETAEPEKFDNRMAARVMTDGEFANWYELTQGKNRNVAQA